MQTYCTVEMSNTGMSDFKNHVQELLFFSTECNLCFYIFWWKVQVVLQKSSVIKRKSACTYSHNVSCLGHHLSNKWRRLCVCSLHFSTTVYPIYLTLGGCIAEDPRNCSVECEDVWTSSSRETKEEKHYGTADCGQFINVINALFTTMAGCKNGCVITRILLENFHFVSLCNRLNKVEFTLQLH